jgi:serine phosphatase RsbU (regulator of sigma subunit)
MFSIVRPDGDHREQWLRRAAREVQRHLLPKSAPILPGYEFFVHYQAAGLVSGDYYDFIPLSHNRWAIALGDVSGKDVPAALIGARFSGDTRYSVLLETDPAPATTSLNKRFSETGFEEGFITLSLGVLEVGARRFTYCSAGHPPILIRRAGGRIDAHGHEIKGFPLGIAHDAVYRQASVTLEPGDVVIVYSDGVTDAHNVHEEVYDSEENPRLRRRLGLTNGGPQATGRDIIEDIQAFSAGRAQFDDITLICFGPVDLPRPDETAAEFLGGTARGLLVQRHGEPENPV